MKKLVVFISVFFVAISFNSCSDDDDEVVVADKIIGKWQLDQAFEDNVETPLTACDKKDTYDFLPAGTFIAREFFEDENEVCVPLEVVNGTWKNLGNSMYELGDFIEIDDMSIDVNVKITFTGNKMTMEFSLKDEDDVTHVLKGVFIKIQS